MIAEDTHAVSHSTFYHDCRRYTQSLTQPSIMIAGAAQGIPGWDRRLRALYNQAKSRGLWRNTYSMSTPEEYFVSSTVRLRDYYMM